MLQPTAEILRINLFFKSFQISIYFSSPTKVLKNLFIDKKLFIVAVSNKYHCCTSTYHQCGNLNSKCLHRH